MARYRGPKGKIVRKFGINIFGNPKFDRLLKKKPYPAGQHGGKNTRTRTTEYGVQLKAKQMVKYTYGVSEKKMKKYFDHASKFSGSTADEFYKILEKRLDNVVFRSGIAKTRAQARQLVTHGFITLNGKRAKTPSIIVEEGDVVSTRKLKGMEDFVKASLKSKGKGVPEWLAVDASAKKVSIVANPDPKKQDMNMNFTLITEFYSRI